MSAKPGLQPRYEVRKVDDPTGKHDECAYFVLDPQHDLIARLCLRLYALHARPTYPELGSDLDAWLNRLEAM